MLMALTDISGRDRKNASTGRTRWVIAQSLFIMIRDGSGSQCVTEKIILGCK